MRVVIATVQVPFIHGGAELLADNLKQEILRKGHEVEIVAVPYKWYPPEKIHDHMLACRLLDLTESNGVKIDRVIGLKFPAYLIPHPNKVLWILHQHRTAYELWDHELGDLIKWPNGQQIRQIIQNADRNLIPEAKNIYTISDNISHRLNKFSGIESVPLYHPPPQAEKFYCNTRTEEYLFFPSRLNITKRQELVLEALKHTHNPIKVYFAGSSDNPSYGQQLKNLAKLYQIEKRITWLGRITENEKLKYYANALAIIYPPIDEDYGYITLEAMLSSKAVITCNDSGGPMEFVKNRKTGLVVSPNPKALASAMDEIWDNRDKTSYLGAMGREHYDSLNINWSNVVNTLLP